MIYFHNQMLYISALSSIQTAVNISFLTEVDFNEKIQSNRTCHSLCFSSIPNIETTKIIYGAMYEKQKKNSCLYYCIGMYTAYLKSFVNASVWSKFTQITGSVDCGTRGRGSQGRIILLVSWGRFLLGSFRFDFEKKCNTDIRIKTLRWQCMYIYSNYLETIGFFRVKICIISVKKYIFKKLRWENKFKKLTLQYLHNQIDCFIRTLE